MHLIAPRLICRDDSYWLANHAEGTIKIGDEEFAENMHVRWDCETKVVWDVAKEEHICEIENYDVIEVSHYYSTKCERTSRLRAETLILGNRLFAGDMPVPRR